jgi:hypothetical protein
MTLPRVAIIVINWNGKEDTLACLTSLQGLDYPTTQIVLIDNGSTDDSVTAMRAAYPNINLIETGQNLGFVGGNNLGLEQACKMGVEYALLLNNDTEVAPDFLRKLVVAAEADPAVGAVGPMIYYYEAPQVIWSAGGAIDWRRGSSRMVGIGEIDEGQWDSNPRAVDFLTGCAFLIKMSVYMQVGGLDPRFFLYYEDNEWCHRISRAGYRIFFVPQAHIWHKISPLARESSPQVHYYMTRNRLLFLKCSQAGWSPWIHTAFEYTRTLVSWSIKPQWRYKAPQRKAMIRAIKDFYLGNYGKRSPF